MFFFLFFFPFLHREMTWNYLYAYVRCEKKPYQNGDCSQKKEFASQGVNSLLDRQDR